MFLTENDAIKKIIQFFENAERRFVYENNNGNSVTCCLLADGIRVDCLGDAGYKEFLPWGVFWHAVHIMLPNGGKASRGSAFGNRLGSGDLPFNSIEGHVASVIYGKQAGDTVHRRISPIAHILVSAEVCVDQRAEMEMVEYP